MVPVPKGKQNQRCGNGEHKIQHAHLTQYTPPNHHTNKNFFAFLGLPGKKLAPFCGSFSRPVFLL